MHGRGRVQATLIPSFAVLLAAGAIWQMSPAPSSPMFDPREFSVARAARHVAVIATSPHPTGSEANSHVLQYLVAELQRRDLSVQVQSTFSVDDALRRDGAR